VCTDWKIAESLKQRANIGRRPQLPSSELSISTVRALPWSPVTMEIIPESKGMGNVDVWNLGFKRTIQERVEISKQISQVMNVLLFCGCRRTAVLDILHDTRYILPPA
jgi:hypothetical protein